MRMCLLFGIGLLIALGEARAETYPPVTAQMSVEQVGPHTFYAQGAAGAATDNEGFVSNAGFVVTDAGVRAPRPSTSRTPSVPKMFTWASVTASPSSADRRALHPRFAPA